MDASKLKNKRWTALVPQRQQQQRLHKALLSKSSSSRSQLIGRLPEEAYLQIYIHLGLSDIVNLALACRKLAALSNDERVWSRKLQLLDWKGNDHPKDALAIIAKRNERLKNEHDASESRAAKRISLDGNGTARQSMDAKQTIPSNKRSSLSSGSILAPIQQPDILASSQSILPPTTNTAAAITDDDDDGFGDFIDFTSDSQSIQIPQSTSSSINDSFAGLTLDAAPLQPSKAPSSSSATKKQDEDLLMLFDDGVDDIGLNNATPLPSKSYGKNPSSIGKATQTNGSSPSTVVGSSTSTYHSPALSRDLFIAYFKHLIPYYVSLQYQSTSSLIFTQPNLSNISRAYILSNLTRLLNEKSIAPTQYLNKLRKTNENLKSSIDYFNSSLLVKFEKAMDERVISDMREAAHAAYALNSATTSEGEMINRRGVNSSSASAAAGGTSVIQVFMDKIPLFYDQSWDPLANLTKTFDTSGQLVDGIDFSAMDSFMNHVIGVVQKEGTTIARVFPKESDALVYFTDRIANDVMSEYIVDLLNAAHNFTNPLFLLTTAATFGQCQRLITTVCNIEPKSPHVTQDSISKIVYEMFRPHTTDYLKDEPEWCRIYLKEICIEWERKLAEERANRDPTFLNASNPQQAKKNILAGFTKALLLPVTIVPKTVALSVNAITTGGTMAFNAMTGTFGASSSSTANGATTPKVITNTAVPSRTGTSTPVTPSIERDGPGLSLHGEGFQSLISIETAMQFIQADRECLKRVQTFAGYTGEVGLRVKRAIEEIFVILCQTVSANHLTPAFAKATEQMGQYKPADHPVDESVAPLVQFFELVHIGDTILQMVQVYYDREMVKYVDKNDFLSQVVREKKKFENALDESVASGLNAGVNILMTQAEYILQTQQETSDFCPELKDGQGALGKSAVLDIEGPTKAAEAVVDCLRSHCQMLKGSTDKAILEVFHQEVGLRLHGMLLKHLKKSIVSISGGFQVIADLNLYTSFVNSLKLPNVNPYFTALKMAANVFIIDSPRDLGLMARDLERYEGTLRIEDIMEMVQCRTDWKRIEREVEKEVFGFKTEDCIIA